MNLGASDMGEVALIADELSRAVELTMNPAISHEARTQAYNACESFKENSPWCAQAGLLLASGAQYSAVVKHFGLQLMEHTIKYRWTHITQNEKIFIKENAMKLLYLGGWETAHLNDALARVIVEMIKREWPQQWGTLLAELSDACTQGHAHTQIVLHVFLRLVEDVATLQTLEQHQRRKDIYQALTSNMAEIFAFFMRLVELHVGQHRALTAAGDLAAADSHGRVVQTVLLTLAGFVEWVSTAHVVADEGRLLQMLCALLQHPAFQLPAAECLVQIAHRKGSTKERKPLLVLASAEPAQCVRRAADHAATTHTDHNYLFLKKIAALLTGLAQQVTSLYAYVRDVDSWLGVVLDTVLLLAAHPSPALAQAACGVWLCLLRHEQLARQPAALRAVPRWLHVMAPRVVKIPYPASRVSEGYDTAAYICMEYDSEHEFYTFFSRARTEMLDSFRLCMSAAPLVTWAYVEQWTRAALAKVEGGRCPAVVHPHHPLHQEWEALSQVLDVVLSRLVVSEPRPAVEEGLRLLALCVASQPPSALLLSLLLSFISALFVFLSCSVYSQLQSPAVGSAGAELLPRVLDKIFAALVCEGTGPEATPPQQRRHRHVKNVRRHAASLLVKLANKYPLLLLPVFGRLKEMVGAALSRPDLSAVESVTLQEALLIVCNHTASFDRQQALVGQVLGECSARWTALGAHMSSAGALASLIGLDRAPADRAPGDSAQDDDAGTARRALLHSLALLLGVVKRTHIPTDPDKAMRGGYSAGVVTAGGNPVWRSPCALHVLPLFPHALALARALHDLHLPHNAGLRHPAHANALGLSAAEKRNLLGLREYDANAPPSTPADRMQNFINTLHDNVCHLVGAAGASLGRELFAAPGLARALSGSVLAQLELLPEQWLRRVLRAALRPLLLHCPPAHHAAVALPLALHTIPTMLTHLSRRWEYITSLYESGKLEEESSESQEVLEDMLVRNLTRDYMDVLKIWLVDGGLTAECGASVTGDMEEDSPSPPAAAPAPPPPPRAPEQVSQLGALLLQHPVVGPAALHTILVALTWNDSMSSMRACSLALPALQALLAAGRLDARQASAALAAVLQALQAHGQHDANQAALLALAVQTYETLRPVFPGVAAVLRAIPDVDIHDLQRLDDKLSAPTNKPHKIDKAKRDLFKKITARLIGRNVGQLFKKEVYILNLPTMGASKGRGGGGGAGGAGAGGALDWPDGAGLQNLFATNT